MSQQPGTSTGSPGPSRPNPVEFKEFNFRLPQNQKKKYSVMQFNRGDNVDLSKWSQAKLERENNKIHYKVNTDDLPKFGAGSEFGRERREEARLKKYGIVSQKYQEQDQPWILRQGGAAGKTAKKFRGRKEGKINENSSYFILAQLGDGTFEAYPVDSWYNFIAMQNYKTFSAEEAEEEFGKRDKTMNYFSVMVQKKLQGANKDDDEKEEKSLKSRGSDLTLMEDDYFLESDEEEDDDSDDEGGGCKKKKKKGGKKKGGAKRPKKKESDSEAEEESDEGDFDGRELDYISENSSDDDEGELAKTDIKGLDQELQEVEEEEEEEKEAKEEEEGNKEEDGKKKEKEGAKEGKENKDDDSSSAESSGSDSDIDEKNIQSAMLLQQKKNTKKGNDKTPPKSASNNPSRSQTPTVMDTGGAVADRTLSDAATKLENSAAKKRPNPTEQPATKRQRTESPVPMAANKTPSGYVPLTEDEVRRYLMRRPMTTKDLLVKLNPKKTGLPKEQIETKLAEILVKLAPEKRKKDSKIYWFIREHSK